VLTFLSEIPRLSFLSEIPLVSEMTKRMQDLFYFYHHQQKPQIAHHPKAYPKARYNRTKT
jgi:hypothetical protein